MAGMGQGGRFSLPRRCSGAVQSKIHLSFYRDAIVTKGPFSLVARNEINIASQWKYISTPLSIKLKNKYFCVIKNFFKINNLFLAHDVKAIFPFQVPGAQLYPLWVIVPATKTNVFGRVNSLMFLSSSPYLQNFTFSS